MNQTFRTLVVGLVVSVVAGCQGCFGCQTSPLDAPDTTLPRTCQAEQPLVEPQRLDILFVIDNSNSMQEEQEAVARELNGFIDEVKKSGGVRQDFNVGVITTSVYQHTSQNGVVWFREFPTQSGRLRPVPTLLPDGGFNIDEGNEKILSGEDPQLAAKFARLVQQGTRGSGQETPFEAVRLALLSDLIRTPLARGGNQGFLRDGARLLIVVLTDEDDCSETTRPSRVTVSDNPALADCTEKSTSLATVSEYHRLFTQELKNGDGTPKEVIWTAIAPVGRANKTALAVVQGGQVRNDDCPTSVQGGYRHRAMAEMFDTTLANLDSICRDSFRQTLINIAGLAAVGQTVEVKNIPAPEMVQLSITRKDGTIQQCTQLNSGVEVIDPGGPGVSTKLRFRNECKRRADDQGIAIRLLCAT